MKLDKPTQDGNRVDGERIPAHRDPRRVREFVARGDEPAASDARRGPRSPRVSVDELVAKGQTVIDRIEAAVRRIADRFRR
jgi:hypothetical protein